MHVAPLARRGCARDVPVFSVIAGAGKFAVVLDHDVSSDTLIAAPVQWQTRAARQTDVQISPDHRRSMGLPTGVSLIRAGAGQTVRPTEFVVIGACPDDVKRDLLRAVRRENATQRMSGALATAAFSFAWENPRERGRSPGSSFASEISRVKSMLPRRSGGRHGGGAPGD